MNEIGWCLVILTCSILLNSISVLYANKIISRRFSCLEENQNELIQAFNNLTNKIRIASDNDTNTVEIENENPV